MLTEMLQFCAELDEQYRVTDLRGLAQWSYEQREVKKRNVPYMAIIDTFKMGRKTEVSRIVATPTVKQKKLREFFNQKTVKYQLEVELGVGVRLYEFSKIDRSRKQLYPTK